VKPACILVTKQGTKMLFWQVNQFSRHGPPRSTMPMISFNANLELLETGSASYFSVDPVMVLKGPVLDYFRYRRDISQFN